MPPRLRPEKPTNYPLVRPYQAELDLGGDNPVLDAVNTSGIESEWIDCKDKYLICIASEYSNSNVAARIRVILKDSNDIAGRLYSDDVGIKNTGRQDGIRNANWYHGQAEYASTFGAIAYKILLDSTPTNSGFISVYTGEV